jgi:hypothetical protein
MTAPKNFKWTFRDVFVYSKAIAYVVAGHDTSGKQDLPGCALFRWSGGWSAQPFAINGTGVTVTQSPEVNVLVMGAEGKVIRWGKGGMREETIDSSEEGPQNYGDLREIRNIGAHAYVVGMRRTAYRCENNGLWKRIDGGVRCSEEDESDAGFNSIDGFNESEIYAVGWDGEIWAFNGRKWKELRSPTNLGLFRVMCAPDGMVYACGQKGIVIVGRGDKWSVIEPISEIDTLWGATYFGGIPYFCATDGLFALKKGSLEPIPIKIRLGKEIRAMSNPSLYRLSSNDEVIWAVGSKVVLFSNDGAIWSETPYGEK